MNLFSLLQWWVNCYLGISIYPLALFLRCVFLYMTP